MHRLTGTQPTWEGAHSDLTAQERLVLEFLANGGTGPQIAHTMCVAVTTVRTHIRALRDKLGASTQAGIVAEGFRRGLLLCDPAGRAARGAEPRLNGLVGRGAGCGCKMGKELLVRVLDALPEPPPDPNLLVGFKGMDDACVYRVTPDLAIAASVDFFTPIADDPATFGAIAAVNALSDLFAMGASPLFALAVCAYPKDGNPDELAAILGGGARAALNEGCPVLGGHTIDDPEPKYGLAVVGIVDPRHVMVNSGGHAGDHLVVTKPIGVGVAATARSAGAVTAATLQAATELMLTSNRVSSDCARTLGIRCATDITGYGLLGHLGEVTFASGLEARISMSAVPKIPESPDLVKRGFVSGGLERNRAHAEGFAVFAPDLPEEMGLLACDPQTSGGLLLAVPDDPSQLIAALRERGIRGACIGQLQEGVPGRVYVDA